MAAPPKPYHPPEEYLALERAADVKSAYLAGAICAMAGASEQHNTVTINSAAQLHSQFRGRPCRKPAISRTPSPCRPSSAR